jgi:hypothetical protein
MFVNYARYMYPGWGLSRLEHRGDECVNLMVEEFVYIASLSNVTYTCSIPPHNTTTLCHEGQYWV